MTIELKKNEDRGVLLVDKVKKCEGPLTKIDAYLRELLSKNPKAMLRTRNLD